MTVVRVGDITLVGEVIVGEDFVTNIVFIPCIINFIINIIIKYVMLNIS
jgi:hypothetical protein